MDEQVAKAEKAEADARTAADTAKADAEKSAKEQADNFGLADELNATMSGANRLKELVSERGRAAQAQCRQCVAWVTERGRSWRASEGAARRRSVVPRRVAPLGGVCCRNAPAVCIPTPAPRMHRRQPRAQPSPCCLAPRTCSADRLVGLSCVPGHGEHDLRVRARRVRYACPEQMWANARRVWRCAGRACACVMSMAPMS